MATPPHLAARPDLGRRAESLACAHLEAAGYAIVARNVRVGRLELDVIAQRGGLIVFCEVRSRTRDDLMTPAQTIGPQKVARIRRAAASWLRAERPGALEIRFDVASIVFDRAGDRLNYLVGAF